MSKGVAFSQLAVGYQIEYILMLTYATVLLVVGLEQLVAVWKTGEKRRRKRWQMRLNFAAACLVFLGSIDPLGFFSGDNVWGLLADSRFFFWMAGYTVYMSWHNTLYSLFLGNYVLVRQRMPRWYIATLVALPLLTSCFGIGFVLAYAGGARRRWVLAPVYIGMAVSTMASLTAFGCSAVSLLRKLKQHMGSLNIPNSQRTKHLTVPKTATIVSSNRVGELLTSISRLRWILALTIALSVLVIATNLIEAFYKLDGKWTSFPSYSYQVFSIFDNALAWEVTFFIPVAFWFEWVQWPTQKRVSPGKIITLSVDATKSLSSKPLVSE